MFCVQVQQFLMDPTELPSSSKRVSAGTGEPAGTHEKIDQSTGEVLHAVGCRDDRTIVDSASVVHVFSGLCDVGSERVQYSLKLERVLGESLQYYGIKRNVPLTNRSLAAA